MKKLCLSFLWLFLFYSTAVSQSNCSSTQLLSIGTTCNFTTVQKTANETEKWFYFYPTKNQIKLFFIDPGDVIAKAQIYGINDTNFPYTSCSASGLYYSDSSIQLTTDSMEFYVPQTGIPYMIKLSTTLTNTTTTFSVGLSEKYESTSWTYLFNSNNGSSSCTGLISNGTGYDGNLNCNTITLCVDEVLDLSMDYALTDDFYFQFINQNGASIVFDGNPTSSGNPAFTASMSFSTPGTVSFILFPYVIYNSSNNTIIPDIANNIPAYTITLNIVNAPVAAQWTNQTVCAGENLVLTAASNAAINNVVIDGNTTNLSGNPLVIDSDNYSVGTHTLTYTVNGCGNATFTTTFTILSSFDTQFTMDNCGNATLTFTKCATSNTSSFNYSIFWGDGTSSINVFENGSFTLTHQYGPGNFNWTLNINQLPFQGGALITSFTDNTGPITATALPISGPSYACEIGDNGYAIPPLANFSSISWSTSPTLSFSGQNTLTITPTPAWYNSSDITVSVLAYDNNGCTYSGSVIVLGCCSPSSLPNNEFFERTYYTHSSPTSGLANQFPANVYRAPTNVAISLVNPPTTPAPIHTPYSSPMSVTGLIANYGVPFSGGVLTLNKQYFFNNDLIIDVNVTIQNAHYLRFAPNVKIIVNPGVHLKINGSTLAPSCNEMWQGIYSLSNTSKITLFETSIIGAINGVFTNNGATLDIQNSRFIDNYIGIRKINKISSQNDVITFNYFGDVTSNPLLAPYNNLLMSAAGIRLENVNNITIGNDLLIGTTPTNSGNLFHFVQVGIDGDVAQVAAYRNVFHNIIQQMPQPFANTGDAYTGIRMKGFKTASSSLIAGATTNDGNLFFNCAYGISAKNKTNLSAQFNAMKNIRLMGMCYENNQNCLFTATSNNLNAYSYNAWGIYVKNNIATTVNLNNNTINNLAGASLAAGIYVASVPTLYGSTVTVSNNTITNCLRGIWVINVPKTTITSNFIYSNLNNSQINNLVSNFAPMRGILVQASPRSIINNNTVKRINGVFTANDREKLNGIRLENSKQAVVMRNTMDGLPVGFYAQDFNPGSKVACNNMNACNYGFYMKNTDIGPQGTPTVGVNNSWYNTINEGTDGTLIGYSLANPMNYYHGSNTAFNSDATFAISGLPNYWKDIFITSTQSPCGSAINEPETEPELTEDERERQFASLFTTPAYDSLAAMAQHLMFPLDYAYFMANPTALTLGSNDDPYKQFMTDMNGTFAQQNWEINKSLSEDNKVTAAQQVNNLLATNAAITDYKTVLGMYLSPIISSEDSVTLRTLARAEPMTSGWAVYLARTILDLDAGFGNNAERMERTNMEATATVAVQVYPNPNKGEFHLVAASDMATITIVDLNGKKVLEQNAIGNETTIFSNLQRGIYLIHVTLTNGATATAKLVVE